MTDEERPPPRFPSETLIQQLSSIGGAECRKLKAGQSAHQNAHDRRGETTTLVGRLGGNGLDVCSSKRRTGAWCQPTCDPHGVAQHGSIAEGHDMSRVGECEEARPQIFTVRLLAERDDVIEGLRREVGRRNYLNIQ